MPGNTFYMQLLHQQQSGRLNYTTEEINNLLKKIDEGGALSKEDSALLQEIKEKYENGGLGKGPSCECDALNEEDIENAIGEVEDNMPEDIGAFTEEDIDSIWEQVLKDMT